MTEYVVPMGTPEFFHVTTPVTGAGYTWAGAYPYIDTPDLGASYGEINMATTGDSSGQWVGTQFPAYVAPAGITGARVDIQILSPAGSDASYHGVVWKLFDDGSVFRWGSSPVALPAGVWVTIADVDVFDPLVDPGYDLPSLIASLTSGTLKLLAHQGQTGATFQVSYLRLTLIGGIPLPNLSGQLLDDRVRFT